MQVEEITGKTVKQKELMLLKEKTQKIDDCLIACISFEKKLEGYSGMRGKIDEIERTMGTFAQHSALEDLELKVDRQRLSLIKVDAQIDKGKHKAREHQTSIGTLTSMVR